MAVLKTLLWGFHNQDTGRCFPGYEAIAARARVERTTVWRAIHALEAAGLLSWENRLVWVRKKVGATVVRIAQRTSNAYVFMGCAPMLQTATGTVNQESIPFLRTYVPPPLDPDSPLGRALNRLGAALGA